MNKRILHFFNLLFCIALLYPGFVAGQKKMKREKNSFLSGLAVTKQLPKQAFNAKRKIPLSTDLPIKLYGSVLNSNDWFWETKYGVYSIETSNPAVLNQVFDNPDRQTYGAVYVDGKYYSIAENTSTNTLNYDIYDVSSWIRLSNKELPSASLVADMTFDPLSGKTFAITLRTDGTGLQLSSFNLETAAMTTIGNIPQLVALTTGKDAVLYGIGLDGNFYSINKITAAATLIGATGLIPANSIQSSTYDSGTGNIYWSAVLSDNTSGLYSINATTGQAALVSEYPDTQQISGLYSTTPFVFSAAPDTVRSLKVTFTNQGSQNGTINFTLPVTTHDGAVLSGAIYADLYVNKALIKTFTQDAGSVCAFAVNFGLGIQLIEVKVRNLTGSGPASSVSVWSGLDTPGEVSGLLVTKNTNRSVTIDWEAPIKTQHGGYADFATITFDVVRLPDNVIVATGLTKTTFADASMSEDLKLYHYTVTPITAGGAGGVSISNEVILGEYCSIPYAENFESESSLKLWTIIDNNGGVTWRPFQGTAAYLLDYLGETPGDDWLISPSVKMEASKVYKLSFIATIPNSSKVSENFKVTIGTSASIAGQTTVLADYSNYMSSSSDPKELKLTVPSDGVYNFGFYEYSEPNRFRLMLDNVKLIEAGSAFAPNAVTDATLVPEANGALSAQFTFNAPTVSYGGKALTEITKIEIYRDGTDGVLGTLNNPTPGAVLNYTDITPLTGANTYRIVALNSFGAGPETVLKTYTGVDTPVAIDTPELKSDEGKAKISWIAPTKGTNGGYINAAALTYRIVRNDDVVVAENLVATNFVDELVSSTGAQKFISYTIYPRSVTAEGAGSKTNKLSFGTPLTLPYVESFKEADYTAGPWDINWLSGSSTSTWAVTESGEYPSATAIDDDGGLIGFNSIETSVGSMSRLVSPSINISTSANPKLSFWVYNNMDEYADPDLEDRLQVEVSADNATFESLGDAIYLNKNTTGWHRYEMSLYPYRNSKSINIAFKGISGNGFNIYMDSIAVRNYKDNDLSITSFTGSKRVSVGVDEEYAVHVKNSGSTTTGNYTVSLYKDGYVLATQQGESIVPETEHTFVFNVSATLDDITIEDNKYAYVAKIDFNTDEVLSNNVSDAIQVSVRKPSYPSATNLAATATNKDVNLTWTAAATRATAVSENTVEDFETYPLYSIADFGDWTLVDGDKLPTLNSPRAGENLHKGEPMAFQVMSTNPEDDIFTAQSGSQYLVSLSAEGGKNNDWLISPILTAQEQEISFWAKSATDLYGSERLVVWYSTTDNHPDSFKKLSFGDYLDVPTYWYNYNYTLPAGARYFAIQCVSDQAIMLFVDNISYTKSIGDPETINFLGYNVYCGDILLNSTPITATEYSDINKEDGTYAYKVTAVYDKGESVYSNEATIGLATGFESNYADNIKIYGGENVIHISHAKGNNVKIFTMDGKLIYQTLGKQQTDIPAQSGLYMVRVGTQTGKVIVQ